MEDSNKCAYRVQVDKLVLEANVEVDNSGALVQPPRIEIYLHEEKTSGIEMTISKGQLVAMIQFLDAIWTQIGGQVLR